MRLIIIVMKADAAANIEQRMCVQTHVEFSTVKRIWKKISKLDKLSQEYISINNNEG